MGKEQLIEFCALFHDLYAQNTVLCYTHTHKITIYVTGLELTSLLVPNENSLSKNFVFFFLHCGSVTIPLLFICIYFELFNIFIILKASMIQVPCIYALGYSIEAK